MATRSAVLLLSAILLAGCGSTAEDPHQQLRDAARVTSEVKTVLVDVSFGPGATVQGLQLLSATGRVRRPADSDTTGKVKTLGTLLQPELISTGGKTFLREAQFLPFHELTDAEAAGYPSAGRLIDRDKGVNAILPKGRDVKSAGDEQVDGHSCARITATYTAADIGNALAPIQLTDDVHVTLWVDHDSNLLRRVRVTGHLFSPTAESFVDARLHDFNSNVSITAPS